LTVLVNVLFVLDQLVLELLLQVEPLAACLRQTVDDGPRAYSLCTCPTPMTRQADLTNPTKAMAAS